MRFFIPVILFSTMLVGCGSGFNSEELRLIREHRGGLMPVMSISNHSDSLLLRTPSHEMSRKMARSEEFGLLKKSMLTTVKDPANDGVGIAAPQVGVLRRVVAVQRFDKPNEEFEIFLNPEIVSRSAEQKFGGEGCLSVPDLSGNVERSEWIVLRYRDEEYHLREDTIKGFTAVIFQHEVDHLDGRLFIDYLK